MADDTKVTELYVRGILTAGGRPCWYPDTAILTQEEAAAVLGVDLRTLKRYKIRRAHPGHRTVRYLYRDIVAFLDERAA